MAPPLSYSQSPRSRRWMRYILSQHMADGLFFLLHWFFIMFALLPLFNCKFYFVDVHGLSLMYCNVYCMIWGKGNAKSCVNPFKILLLSVVLCQAKNIWDVLIDSSVQKRASRLWLSPHVNSAQLLHGTHLQRFKSVYTQLIGAVSFAGKASSYASAQR